MFVSRTGNANQRLLLNEAESDVKNHADRGGACHRLDATYIFQTWQPCAGYEDLAAGPRTIRNGKIF